MMHDVSLIMQSHLTSFITPCNLRLKLKVQTNVWDQYENIKFELSLGWLKMWILNL